MPAQEQSPSIPADSQEATEEEAKEVNDNKKTKSDFIFPAAINPLVTEFLKMELPKSRLAILF